MYHYCPSRTCLSTGVSVCVYYERGVNKEETANWEGAYNWKGKATRWVTTNFSASTDSSFGYSLKPGNKLMFQNQNSLQVVVFVSPLHRERGIEQMLWVCCRDTKGWLMGQQTVGLWHKRMLFTSSPLTKANAFSHDHNLSLNLVVFVPNQNLTIAVMTLCCDKNL